jgi:hypothetical protein
MEVLYVMYVEIERNVKDYQVVTLCSGIRRVYFTDSISAAIQIVIELGKKYDIYLDASGYGSGAAEMLNILKIPHRIVKHETVIAR